MNVYWNNDLILSAPGTSIGNLNIQTKSFYLDAVEGENSLTLLSTGTSDGGITVDNVQLYQADDGNREDVNTPNGTMCECKYGYFDDGQNFDCALCASVSPGCQDCEYNSLNSTFNLTWLTCTDCLDG